MRLLLGSLSAGTDSAYAPGLEAFLAFCTSHCSTFPPSGAMVLAFAVFLFEILMFTHTKVKRYVTAVRSLCVDVGAALDPFESPRLLRMYKGMARERPGPPARQKRLPITAPLLVRLINALGQVNPRLRALRAGLAIGFWALLRAGEFAFKGVDAHGNKYSILERQHVTWEADHVVIFLAESKTDYTRRGVRVKIYRSAPGQLCAYTLLHRAWALAPRQVPSAPLLQVDESGSPLTYRDLLCVIKSTLARLGFSPAVFGTHSLRIGGASQMAMCGFSVAQIKAAGRWESDCYLQYIRLGDPFYRSVASAFASAAVASLTPFGSLSPLQATAATRDNVVTLFGRQPNRRP